MSTEAIVNEGDQAQQKIDQIEVVAKEVTPQSAAKQKKPKAKKGEKLIEITRSPAGRFLLNYHVGQLVAIEAKQAEEMVEYGCAKEI